MSGRFVRLEPLDVGHARDLYDANALDREGRNWTYLAYGPYAAFEPYREWVAGMAASQDPLFHTIVDLASGKAVGVASYLRIDPKGGVIEVGHINYSPLLQKKPGATEAMFLMMQRAFDDLGIAATSGNATASTRRRGGRPSGSALSTKAFSGRRPSTRTEIAIRLGIRSSMENGRR